MSITTTVGPIPAYLASAAAVSLTDFYTAPSSCNNRYVAAETPDVAWSTYSRVSYTAPVDPTYYSCLPSNLHGPQYSPGVCTAGQTMAGMTKFDGGARTMWQAQCCDSGMSISTKSIQGSAVPMCMSAFSSMKVHALVTTTISGAATTFYDLALNDKTTVSNISTIAHGTAIADPLYVAWEAKDLSYFPVAYATSLAQKIGVDFTPTATPKSRSGASSSIASRTGISSSSSDPSGSSSSTAVPADSHLSGLSTGAKLGIGLGVGIGALLVAALIGMAFIIRRLKRRERGVDTPYDEHHPAMAAPLPEKKKWYHRASAGGEVGGGYNGNGGVAGGPGPGELDSFPVHYVPGQAPVELEGNHITNHMNRGY